MSTDDQKKARLQTMVDASMMSTERPLDAFLPDLRTQEARLPKTALHPRVLDVERESGYEWILALWQDPGSAKNLHDQARQLIEATMLAELSRTPAAGETLNRTRAGLRLEAFSTVETDLSKALRAFGFSLSKDSIGKDSLDELRREGTSMGWDVPETPVSSWFASAEMPAGEHGEKLNAVHLEMINAMQNDVWGMTPGGPSKLAANLLSEAFGTTIEPTDRGMRSLELLLVQTSRPNVIRWIPPILFQAMCDFVGVVLSHHYKLQVEWAECTPEEGDYGPPPVFRVMRKDGDFQHLPIGLHLLRWCIMPILEGDEIPPLSEWMEFEFGAGAH